MRSISLALVVAAVAGTGAFAQQPAHPPQHPTTMPEDTSMAGMAMPRATAGMDMAMAGPLGISETREGSGTAWQPELTPMYALHRSAGGWSLISGRLWLLPTDRVAIQLSDGFLKQAERAADGGRTDVHRATASLTYHAPLRTAGLWANTLVWGQNRAHGLVTNAGLLETSLDLDDRNVIFGRGELDQKSGDDLALDAPALADRTFCVGKLALGYSRQLTAGPVRPGIGAEVSLDFVPPALKPFYGSTTSAGFAVFASVHPGPMRTSGHVMPPMP